MKILVIEDEILLANSIQTLLTSRGFQTEAVYGPWHTDFVLGF